MTEGVSTVLYMPTSDVVCFCCLFVFCFLDTVIQTCNKLKIWNESTEAALLFSYHNINVKNVFLCVLLDNEVEVEKLCNFQAIVQHLDLSKDSIKYTVSRPIINNSHHTDVVLDMKLYAILDMVSCPSYLCMFVCFSLNKW